MRLRKAVSGRKAVASCIGKSIPVGKDGYVPFDAIVTRYHEVGNPHDADKTKAIVLPSYLTPDEISEWWNNPSVCDIDGIDTGDSAIYTVPLSIKGKKRSALKKIAVIGTKKESDRIKKILAESFTAEELEKMSSGRSLVIKASDKCIDDCTGIYYRRQKSVSVPQIVLEEGTTADGIVHEAVHHLRTVDGRTSFPTTKSGVLSKKYTELSENERADILRREETETVAETLARTKKDSCESGYYDYVPGAKSTRAAYLHDRRVMGRKQVKGKAAIKAVEENYNRTCISRAIISANRKKVRK